MLTLSAVLELARCPHCNVDSPSLNFKSEWVSTDHHGYNSRRWAAYVCKRCGGAVLAGGDSSSVQKIVREFYPKSDILSSAIPQKAREFLDQAVNSLHAPAGAVMLTASSVDAMLKAKGYTEGHLYDRINKASEDHLITSDMAEWAHQVRLDANDQRHADEESGMPTTEDAKRSIDFTRALGDILFELPSRVTRGLKAAEKTE